MGFWEPSRDTEKAAFPDGRPLSSHHIPDDQGRFMTKTGSVRSASEGSVRADRWVHPVLLRPVQGSTGSAEGSGSVAFRLLEAGFRLTVAVGMERGTASVVQW